MQNSANQKKLIVITGPTAVGKTELSLKACIELNTHIISADSRQIYKELNIGTAKASIQELSLVPHHFINHISIKEGYSTGQYEREALELINTLFKTHDKIIVSGGTGLYLNAILEGLDHFPKVSAETVLHYNHVLETDGLAALQQDLKEKDPDYYSNVDTSNHRRLIRALSVQKASGEPYSHFLKKNKKERNFEFLYLVLTRDRQELYDRINQRVDQMMEDGLEDEVRSLISFQEKQALQTVGYQELFNYINGIWDLETAISKIKQHSRNYAKRQMTWFRRVEKAKHILASSTADALQLIKRF